MAYSFKKKKKKKKNLDKQNVMNMLSFPVFYF